MTEPVAVPRPRRPGRGVVAAVLAASVLLGVATGAMVATARDRPNSPGSVPTTARPTPTPSATTTYAPLPRSAAPLDDDQFVVPRGPKDDTRLYLARVAGPVAPQRLSSPKGEKVNSPTLSADRRTLIYVDRTTQRLRTMAADGSHDQQLFDGLPTRCDEIWHVSWSRTDPTTLVIRCTSASGPNRLMVIDLEGTVIRMLADPHEYLDDPVISPDGQLVAYWAADASSGSPGGGAIYTRRVDGSDAPRRLTRPTAGRDADPAWSPDGSQIAFRRRISERDLDVFRMRSDGSGETRVVGGPSTDEKPLWSPDGRQLMIISNRTDSGEVGSTDDLYLVDAAGGRLEPLGLGAAEISTPVWSAR